MGRRSPYVITIIVAGSYLISLLFLVLAVHYYSAQVISSAYCVALASCAFTFGCAVYFWELKDDVDLFYSVRLLLWRAYKRVAKFPDDRNLRYWESAAKICPETAICSRVQSREEFSMGYSIVNHPSVHLSKDDVVLDLGCGLGRVASLVAPHVKQYVGVDFSKTMLKKAQDINKAYSNVVFIKNDGWSLEHLGDNTFTFAFCELFFQHLPRFKSMNYTNEVHRVLKDGGIFLAEVPRLDYYRDDKFSFTTEQADAMFSKFSKVELLDFEYSGSYFLVRATK